MMSDMAATPDGGYIMVGYYANVSWVYLIKTDADGFLQWSKKFKGNPLASGDAITLTQDGGYAIAGFFLPGTSGTDHRQVYLLKTDKAGNLLWSKTYGGITADAEAFDLLEMPDGSLAICGYQKDLAGKEDLLVLKTSADGDLLWSKTVGDALNQEKGFGIAQAGNGDLVVAGEKRNGPVQDIYVVRLDGNDGNVIWENVYGLYEVSSGSPAADIARDIVETNDGGFVIAGKSTVIEDGSVLLKIDGSGNNSTTWLKIFDKADFYGLAKTPNGGFLVTGNRPTTFAQEDLYVVRTDSKGNILCEGSVGRAGVDRGQAILPTPDGGVVAAGSSELFVGPFNEEKPYLVKMDKNCVVFTSYIQGHIFHDFNSDCKLDAGEPGLEDWIVRIESPNYTRYAAANSNGDFEILADTGIYKITLYPPNDAWEACNPVTTLHVADFSDTFAVNIPVHARSACPRNEVDVATPVLRRCADNTYTVRYCNSGTIPSLNTRVEVTLDPSLTLKSSSIPAVLLKDNTYAFNIGFLENGKCGSFTFVANLDCDQTVTGQTHCVSAHIYPDSFCNATNWDRSIVVAKAKCENDTVKLSLQNIGPGDMTTPVGFVIVEDIILLTDPDDQMYQIQLKTQGDSLVWSQQATGKTYRIISKQTPGYPGTNYATAAVEGCRAPDSSSFTIGYYTMFPEDVDAFKSSDCQESNEIDFNPDNLKRGHPKGYDSAHYVRPETDLEFLIQFQNSTTDTVHQVIVRDTLSPFLDPATVHPGAASHPYDFDVYGNGIVQFTLSNLNLVPGSSASEGFVKFRVSQRPEKPCETKILNSAAIYFDYNAPVLTNQTFHTVCEFDSFVVVKTKDIHFAGADIKVYPNPFDESATFEVSGVQASGYLLEVYDLQGKKLIQQDFNHPTFRLYRHQLPAGMLFYRLTTDKGRPVASGKLLVR